MADIKRLQRARQRVKGMGQSAGFVETPSGPNVGKILTGAMSSAGDVVRAAKAGSSKRAGRLFKRWKKKYGRHTK